MKATMLVLCAGLGLALAGCGREEEESAMDNVTDNPQQYYDTTAEPAGPRDHHSPASQPNE
ncbi:hypothetical protein [Stutzerimonas tarimensis]|uniref:Lipoprotein n=1 Tax=Stutzerimonas tarimensis TaxID=1507735 RepID=A0ABV7T5E0_9GAMM